MSWITKQIAWGFPGAAEAETEAERERAAEREGDLLTDAFLESYVCWREACVDVRGTYERWANSDPRESGLAFVSHQAALDREEHAARVYSDSAERLRRARTHFEVHAPRGQE